MTGSIDSLPTADASTWEARLRNFKDDEVDLAFDHLDDEERNLNSERPQEVSRVSAEQRKADLSEEFAGDLEQSVAQRKEPLLRLEKAGQKLKANRLDELSEDDVRAIEESNGILDGLEPLDHLELDVSTGVGFDSFQLSNLAPLAEKLGHPLMREGKPDFEKLAEATTKFFLAALRAFVDVYDRIGARFPVRRVADLPLDELKVLFVGFGISLDQHHPELKPDANYKLSQLQEAAEEFLARANQDRLRSGSDLFEKALLGSDGDLYRNEWAE